MVGIRQEQVAAKLEMPGLRISQLGQRRFTHDGFNLRCLELNQPPCCDSGKQPRVMLLRPHLSAKMQQAQ
jgi:hypothetical protein